MAAALDLDPQHLEKAEERLFALRAMARKHGAAVEELPAIRERLSTRLAAVAAGEGSLKKLAAAEAKTKAAFLAAAETLSKVRAGAAAKLDKAVAAELPPLKLDKARFEHTGSLRCAHTDRALESIKAEADWVRTTLNDTSMSVQSRAQIEHETGSKGFVGGVLSADAGTILPLEYVRGLAAGIESRGVPIYENTPVTGMSRADDKRVELIRPRA